jgi:putative isomerase
MNFYPLICGAPDAGRAARALQWLYREDKFWLPWLVPTVAKDDPVWPAQSYWHGHVWPPANYLVWLAVQRYGDSAHQAEYARRSVALFMRNWKDKRLNCENYRSTDGGCGNDPHYTWGALLPLIGVEAFASVGADLRPVPRDVPIAGSITLRRIPFGGRLYRIEAANGKVTVSLESQQPGAPAPGR